MRENRLYLVVREEHIGPHYSRPNAPDKKSRERAKKRCRKPLLKKVRDQKRNPHNDEESVGVDGVI